MLKVRAQNLGGVVVVSLQGQIVTGQTQTLRRALAESVGATVLVLDLARVSRIDAHGLGVLLDVRQQLDAKGIEFRLMNVTKLVRHVLAITKLDTVFEFTGGNEIRASASGDRFTKDGKLVLAPCD